MFEKKPSMKRQSTITRKDFLSLFVPLFTLLLPFTATAAPTQVAAPMQVKVSGYLQSRFVSDQSQSPQSDFLVRRARVKLASDISDNVSFVVSFDVAMKTLLKDTAVQWTKGPYKFCLGQRKVPFGFEIPQGDEIRLALERDKVFDVFPSTYDRGAFFNYAPLRAGVPTTYTLAVLNGNGENDDNDNCKNLALRAQSKPKWGSIGASYYTGDYRDATSGKTTAAVRSGLDFQYDARPVGLHGEFVGGRSKGNSIQGWYLEATCSPPKKPGTLFLRQSAFDPNTDAANDQYTRTLIGYSYDLDPNQKSRLTVQYGFVNDKSTPGSDNAFGLQMQVIY